MNIEAKCVVAADGYESQVGRWAGFKTLLKAGDITGTLQYRLTNISEGHDFPDYCEFWLGTCAPAGYIWVFPKDESTANVGIGVSLDRLKNRVDIIQVLAQVGVTKLSVRAILKVLKETRPELVAKFAEFI